MNYLGKVDVCKPGLTLESSADGETARGLIILSKNSRFHKVIGAVKEVSRDRLEIMSTPVVDHQILEGRQVLERPCGKPSLVSAPTDVQQQSLKPGHAPDGVRSPKSVQVQGKELKRTPAPVHDVHYGIRSARGSKAGVYAESNESIDVIEVRNRHVVGALNT